METVIFPVKNNKYTQVNVGIGSILIEARDDEVYVIVSEFEPDPKAETFHRVKKNDRLPLTLPGNNTWVMGTADKQNQNVIITEEASTLEVAADGSTGLKVYTQDQTTGVLGIPFLNQIGTTTLAVDSVVNSRFVTLTAGHGAVAGQILEIADPTSGSNFIQARILAVAVNVIELDSPINRIYLSIASPVETRALVAISVDNMLVDGSTTPVVFSVLPFPVQAGDMVRIIPEINGSAAMDFTTFGSDPALTRGIVLRINNGDGTYRHLYNFKRNSDIIVQCFDHDFFTNIGNNARAFISRLTWGGQSKHGVVIRLRGAELQSLEMVIQEDLTAAGPGGANTLVRFIAQGSEIQD